MDENKKVWVPHPVDGFKLGKIVDIGSDTITVEPFNSNGQVEQSRADMIRSCHDPIDSIRFTIHLFRPIRLKFLTQSFHLNDLLNKITMNKEHKNTS